MNQSKKDKCPKTFCELLRRFSALDILSLNKEDRTKLLNGALRETLNNCLKDTTSDWINFKGVDSK